MALPKRKQSNSRTGKRRSHDALTPPNLARCPRCNADKMPHRVCANCGYYRGRAVLDLEQA